MKGIRLSFAERLALPYRADRALALTRSDASSALAGWLFSDGVLGAGVWQDFRPWSPTGLFINGQLWKGGAWDDAMAW